MYSYVWGGAHVLTESSDAVLEMNFCVFHIVPKLWLP